MGYSVRMTAALSGASERQLQHWRSAAGGRAPLFKPEYSNERPVTYSFRDLIALRGFVYLREQTSLQRIRRAVGHLRELGERKHLSSYRFAVEGRSIVLVEERGEGTDLVQRPGQRLLARLADIVAPFETRGFVVPDLFMPADYVEIDPERLGGYPVITGTRVPFDAVAGLVRDGVPPRRVRKYYPSVSADAARSAVDFADYVDEYGSHATPAA